MTGIQKRIFWKSFFEKAENSGCQICGGEFSEYNDRTGEVRTEFPEQYFGYVFQKEGVIEYRDWQFDFGYHRFLYNREFILEHQLYFPKLIRFQDPPFFCKSDDYCRKVLCGKESGVSISLWS